MIEPVSTGLSNDMGRPGEHAEGASFFRSFVQRVPDPNVWRIYGITLALGLAYGTAISVIGRFLTTHGVSKLAIGQLAVGVWVSSESILLARSGKENKAFATSLYAVAVACGYVGGPLLAYACTQFLPLSFAFILAGAIAI